MSDINTNGTVTAGEACKILNIHENTLRRWRTKGYIEAIKKPSGKYLYRVSDLERVYQNDK